MRAENLACADELEKAARQVREPLELDERCGEFESSGKQEQRGEEALNDPKGDARGHEWTPMARSGRLVRIAVVAEAHALTL